MPSSTLDTVPYKALFRYATRFDQLLLFVGLACSFGNGGTLPAFAILFGSLIDALHSKPGGFDASVNTLCIAFVVIGAVGFVLSFGQVSLMNITASRQVRTVRKEYLRSLLRQDMAWHDSASAGDLAARLAEYAAPCVVCVL